MTLTQLRELMAEARDLGVTAVDLARHPLIEPFWSYTSCSEYLRPGYAGKGPSRIYLKLAGDALRDLIARKRGRAAA